MGVKKVRGVVFGGARGVGGREMVPERQRMCASFLGFWSFLCAGGAVLVASAHVWVQFGCVLGTFGMVFGTGFVLDLGRKLCRGGGGGKTRPSGAWPWQPGVDWEKGTG